MTKQITLTKNQIALVDDDMYEYLSQWKWYATKKGNTYYAARTQNIPVRKNIYMHIQIMEYTLGRKLLSAEEVDHINNDGCDNRVSKLRLANHQENMVNSKIRKDNKSGYRGVSWFKRDSNWVLKLHNKNKCIYTKYFESLEDAAKEHDLYMIWKHGAYAKLNFPDLMLSYQNILKTTKFKWMNK